MIVYYLAPIVITWVSNYIFGFLAVSTRSKADVANSFFIIWFIVISGLFVVGVYLMLDVDENEGGFLALGVCNNF